MNEPGDKENKLVKFRVRENRCNVCNELMALVAKPGVTLEDLDKIRGLGRTKKRAALVLWLCLRCDVDSEWHNRKAELNIINCSG